jgi:hypothetical protein
VSRVLFVCLHNAGRSQMSEASSRARRRGDTRPARPEPSRHEAERRLEEIGRRRAEAERTDADPLERLPGALHVGPLLRGRLRARVDGGIGVVRHLVPCFHDRHGLGGEGLHSVAGDEERRR